MSLRFPSPTEPLHGTDTASKLERLTQRLQHDPHERLSAAEMEAMAREVGLDAAFMQEALARVSAVPGALLHAAPTAVPAPPTVPVVAPSRKEWWRRAEVLSPVWWAVGWMMIPLLMFLASMLSPSSYGGPPVTSMMVGIGLYMGGGMILSRLKKEEEEERRYLAAHGAAPGFAASAPVSRERLIETLFSLQRQLEGDRRHRAFLSLDIADAAALKRSASELEVEYSFTQLGRWIEETVREHGGCVQSSAGDGMMCVFPEDAAAVRCARRLQEGLSWFNAERSRLPLPVRLRCGVSAGDVADVAGAALGSLHSAVIDRAARLQKQAVPGEILVSGSVQAAALAELGSPVLSPVSAEGEPIFSWGAGRAI